MYVLTHWGQVTHICVSKLSILGSDNGLSPGRRQAKIWTKDGILLIGPLGTNFSGILIDIHTFSFKKMHLKMSSGKRRPFCLGLNVLTEHSVSSQHDYHKEFPCTVFFFQWIADEIFLISMDRNMSNMSKSWLLDGLALQLVMDQRFVGGRGVATHMRKFTYVHSGIFL